MAHLIWVNPSREALIDAICTLSVDLHPSVAPQFTRNETEASEKFIDSIISKNRGKKEKSPETVNICAQGGS